MGKCKFLETIDHPLLCKYIDTRISKIDENKILVIEECYTENLYDIINLKTIESVKFSLDNLTNIAFKVLKALKYLKDE